MKWKKKIPIVLLFIVMATVAIAAGPNRIAYQGSLTASGGAAIPDASYKMRFTIFDALTLGAQLWQETQTGVAVTGGLFSVELGASTALPDDLFLNPNLYLEVEVDLDGNTTFEGDEKYIPRQHVLSPFLRAYGDNVCTGTLTVVGDLNWSEKTRYVTVHCSAFTPREETYDYSLDGFGLRKSAVGTMYFYAPVYFPDGATLTAMRVYTYDVDAVENLDVILASRDPDTSSYQWVFNLTTTGTAGYGYDDDTTAQVSYQTVDNAERTYFVEVQFPSANTGSDLRLSAVRISYTTTGP
jgi:hypothetical protein